MKYNVYHNIISVQNISSDDFSEAYSKKIMGLYGISTAKRKVFIPDFNSLITDFTRCSYLGLDNHKKIILSSIKYLEEYKSLHWSCARTRLNFNITKSLEENLSHLFGINAIVFSSVFMCNFAIIPLLAGGIFTQNSIPNLVVFDKYCHSSMSYHKPMVSQYTKVATINHNDLSKLETFCRRHKKVVYITDGVCSMGGNCLTEEIIYLQNKYNLFVYYDDAHGISIVGKNGEGFVRSKYQSLENNTIISTSLAKGFGASGGFVMGGNRIFEDAIRRYSPPYAFSVGPNIAAIGAALGSIKIHESNELIKRQNLLRSNIEFFDSHFPLPFTNPILPIKVIPTKSNSAAISIAEKLLRENNLYVSAAFFPTVSKKNPVIRIALTSEHSKSEIQRLINALKQYKEYLKA